MDFVAMADRVALDVLAKAPKGLFKEIFHGIKKKMREQADEQYAKAAKWLESKLRKDLEARGYQVALDFKKGTFRGSPYITTAKLSLKSERPFAEEDERIGNLLRFLQEKFSPKFKFKGVNDGVAQFNVR